MYLNYEEPVLEMLFTKGLIITLDVFKYVHHYKEIAKTISLIITLDAF